MSLKRKRRKRRRRGRGRGRRTQFLFQVSKSNWDYWACPATQPPQLQYWSSLNRLKCYRGSHHKIQLAPPPMWYLQMSENHRAQETYVGSDSNKSSLSAKYQSKLSVRESLRSLYGVQREKKKSRVDVCKRLELVPCQSLPLPPPLELNGGKERCQRAVRAGGETHVNDFVNARLHSVKNVNPL